MPVILDFVDWVAGIGRSIRRFPAIAVIQGFKILAG
jgi:hypothetical protein